MLKIKGVKNLNNMSPARKNKAANSKFELKIK
jgi:hypothetical protein